MRNIAIIAGLILILALAAACTGSEPTREPDISNTAQGNRTTAQPTSDSAPTDVPATIVPELTAAPVANADLEDKPAPTRLERTRRPEATSNICWRTPEVQDKIIEDLQIPSCQLINEGELFRVRKFDVDTPGVEPGDFDHMPNLKNLKIEKLRDFSEPGTFDGLSNLEDLNIRITADGWSDWGGPKPTEITVSKGIFAGLDDLKRLEINSNEINITLESGALDGLDQLEYIQLGGISKISADDLAGLNRVRHVNISYRGNKSDDGQGPPLIPKDLLARVPSIEMVEARGFEWPSSMEMNSLEHICRMKHGSGLTYSGWTPDTVLTVGGKIVEYMESKKQNGRRFCTLKVEEEIQEVLLPTP